MPLKKSVIDAFNIFGLSPNVDYNVAARAYKKLALEHHPDRNHGDHTATERFQKISAAWDICQKHYDNPAYSEESAFGFDDDDDEGFDDDIQDYFMWMFAEMLYERFSARSRRDYRKAHRGKNRSGMFDFFDLGGGSGGATYGGYRDFSSRDYVTYSGGGSGGGGGGGGGSLRNERIQKKEREEFERRCREFEEEVKRDEEEKALLEKEQQAHEELIADAYVRAFKAGREGDGQTMRDTIQEHDLDVNKPERQAKQKNANKKPAGTPKAFESMLHVAAASCDVETVAFLKNRGADLSLLTPAKLSPLHTAIVNGNAQVVRWFLNLKPVPENFHPSRAIEDGKTPLQLAIASGSIEVVGIMLKDAPVHDVEKLWLTADPEIRDVLVTKRGFLPPDDCDIPEEDRMLSKKAQKKRAQARDEERQREEKARRLAEEKARAEEKRKQKEERIKRAQEKEAEEARQKAEEQERIQAAVRRVEAQLEALARVEIAARERAEAETRAKVEAEARAKAEAEARVRAEAEARAKAEEEARAKVEEEARLRAEAEKRAKDEAQAVKEAEARREAEKLERKRQQKAAQAAKLAAKREAKKQQAEKAKAEELQQAAPPKPVEQPIKPILPDEVKEDTKEDASAPKPKVCKPFLRGRCRFGNRCRNLHDQPQEFPKASPITAPSVQEQQAPPAAPKKPCRFFAKAKHCKFGDRCRDAHILPDSTAIPSPSPQPQPQLQHQPQPQPQQREPEVSPEPAKTKPAKAKKDRPAPTPEQLRQRAEQSARDKAKALAKREAQLAQASMPTPSPTPPPSHAYTQFSNEHTPVWSRSISFSPPISPDGIHTRELADDLFPLEIPDGPLDVDVEDPKPETTSRQSRGQRDRGHGRPWHRRKPRAPRPAAVQP